MPVQPICPTDRPTYQRRLRRRSIVRLGGTVIGISLLCALGNASTYVVRKGQTLSQVAALHGTTVAQIAATNGITNIHYIRAGQKLSIGDPGQGEAGQVSPLNTVPIAASLPAPPAPSPSAPSAEMLGVHSVASGETLSAIAKRFGTTLSRLAEVNAIVDVNKVRIGTRLMVPLPAPPPPPPPVPILDMARIPERLKASPERMAMATTFERWANTYGVPVALVMGVAWVESGWQNHVISSAGAVGIGQIMPNTAKWLSERVIKEPLDSSNPDHNIQMTARYIRWLLDRTSGDVSQALGGYYQGLSSIQKSGLYPVSQTYISTVLAATETYF